MGLDAEEIDLVVFLVREHLTMSQVAQKGDIDDEVTVGDFVREVGSIDRLKALYLLTFADMRAVAPKVYNNWRDMLLSELYMRALKILEHGHREAIDPARRLAAVKAAVREQLVKAKAPADEIQKFLDEMPDRYFLTVPEGDVQLHFEMMRALEENPLVCPPSPFSGARIQRVHGRDARSAGTVLKDRGSADGQQSQHPFGAHHHPRRRHRARCVSRVAFWAHRGGRAGRGSLAAGRARPRASDHRPARTSRSWWPRRIRSSTLVRGNFVRRVATEVTIDNRTSEEYHGHRRIHPGPGGPALRDHAIRCSSWDCGFIWRASPPTPIRRSTFSTSAIAKAIKSPISRRSGSFAQKLLERLERPCARRKRRGAKRLDAVKMMSGAVWHELVNRLLDRQAVERGLSANTIEAYAQRPARFSGFL